MLAFGNKALEILLRLAEHIGPRHPDNIETMRASLLGKRSLDRGRF
jgi:hypothetical protein